jgi:hypothetical protein
MFLGCNCSLTVVYHIGDRFVIWVLTLWEGSRLKIFENGALRRIFGPKKDEVTGEWRRLYNEDLCALYSSLNIIRVIKSRSLKWTGHVTRTGERTDAYRIFVGKPVKETTWKTLA